MKKNKFVVDCAILCSLTVVLQILSTLMSNYLQFSLTLALIPVAVACIHYGAKCGIIVSAAMGITLFIECVVGFDVGGGIMFALSPVKTFIGSAVRVVLAACGVILAGALTSKFKEKKWRSFLLSALLPVFNTGIFLLAFITMFNPLLHEWASGAGSTVISYIFLGLVGVNFIIEVITCVALCPAIVFALGKNK
ncbi:MAG: hypothetical protein E7674_02405 [Ruminococcaceae bacterium]|nr:hypothetical protein [Oscillospiraceae bacterium]